MKTLSAIPMVLALFLGTAACNAQTASAGFVKNLTSTGCVFFMEQTESGARWTPDNGIACKPGEPLSGDGALVEPGESGESMHAHFVNGYVDGMVTLGHPGAPPFQMGPFHMGCLEGVPGCVPAAQSGPAAGAGATPDAGQRAQANQARLDKARAGQFKRNRRDLQASFCLRVDREMGLYGGFVNGCDFPVEFVYCNDGSKDESWAAEFDCRKKKFGAWRVGANASASQHTAAAKHTYWGACRDPGLPVDAEFVAGTGMKFRCSAGEKD